MEHRGCMMLRVLINCYHPKDGNALFKFLPEQEAKAVKSLEITSKDLQPVFQDPYRSISAIHYSWIQPALQKFSESLRPMMISALTPEQIAGFKQPPIVPLSDIGKIFILSQLYDKLEIKEHLPIEYLPITDLSPLATWSKSQFTELADLLGLHDLAAEVRRIVDRNHLKNIYNCLTSKQLRYLKIRLHQKEQLVSPKLGIDPTKQDCLKLKQTIHRRGLLRLGKALCAEHPDFIWHIAHILDIRRGTILLKEFQPKEIPTVTKILKQQVLNLLNFLKS